jgi:lipid A 3-O-deacylase
MRTLCLIASAFILTPAIANGSWIETREPEASYLAFSFGNAGLRDPRDFGPEVRVELRLNQRLWVLQPFIGTMGGQKGRRYSFAGFLVELHLSRRFILMPSFAPGFYQSGLEPDLGFPLEFRSQLELSFQFENEVRLGFSLSHLSNAHLGHRNPGVEVIALTYALPLRAWR